MALLTVQLSILSCQLSFFTNTSSALIGRPLQGNPCCSCLQKPRMASTGLTGASLVERWREIQGDNHWKGLLDPLDLELRNSILRYGDFNQAIYDGFDADEHSKYTGSFRYNKDDFFHKVGLTRGRDWGYQVSRYLYGTASVEHLPAKLLLKSYSREAWSKESNAIGYVAVATDSGKAWLGRRDIVIVWRGTMRPLEWVDDFKFGLTDITPLLPPSSHREEGHWFDGLLRIGQEALPKVEKGWLVIYNSDDSKSPYTHASAREQLLNEVKYQIKKHEEDEISITLIGHSLGAALAVLSAFDIAENGLNVRGDGRAPILVTAIGFGCPGVGDAAFKKRCNELPGLRVLRVRNEIDLIKLYPGSLAGYDPVGEELVVDSRKSPYLKDSKNAGDWHNLEAHLHLVAGTHGPNKPFQLAVNRDIALVNKSSEFLKDEYLIPGSWWQEENRGLVQREDGFWYMPDREEQHIPRPEPLNDL